MARTQTMVQLTDELIELLDQYSVRVGVSRSQVIREAVAAFLAAERSAAIDQEIVDGYTKLPQGGEYDADEWGDIGRLMTTLTADQMRQLNIEEGEAGHDPW